MFSCLKDKGNDGGGTATDSTSTTRLPRISSRGVWLFKVDMGVHASWRYVRPFSIKYFCCGGTWQISADANDEAVLDADVLTLNAIGGADLAPKHEKKFLIIGSCFTHDYAVLDYEIKLHDSYVLRP